MYGCRSVPGIRFEEGTTVVVIYWAHGRKIVFVTAYIPTFTTPTCHKRLTTRLESAYIYTRIIGNCRSMYKNHAHQVSKSKSLCVRLPPCIFIGIISHQLLITFFIWHSFRPVPFLEFLFCMSLSNWLNHAYSNVPCNYLRLIYFWFGASRLFFQTSPCCEPPVLHVSEHGWLNSVYCCSVLI